MDLLDIDADIVAGIYPIPNANKPPVWSVYHRMDNVFQYATLNGDRELMTAGAAGTGAMIIKRHVLEDPKMRHSPDEKGVPCIFQTPRSPSGFCLATDDLDFCRRAVDAGYKLVVDTGVRWGHIKTHDVANFDEAVRAAGL